MENHATLEQSRAEQSRAEQSRAEQSRAEQSFPVKIFRIIKRGFNRVAHKGDTVGEFILFLLDYIFYITLKKNFYLYSTRKTHQLTQDGVYCLREIKLPLLNKKDADFFFKTIVDDTLCSYLYLNDVYDEKTVNYCDSFLSEGLYGFQNGEVDVTVQPGDIVIDAGAWVGDFAAYASVKGATVYAFEPTTQTFDYLVQTAQLNPGITPVKKGLSNEDSRATIFIDDSNSEGNTLLAGKVNVENVPSETIETTTIDDFVREQGLERVDFIKADIEGYERHMLAGAQETLRRFAPKLALCTYHLPDDPEVMAALIKQANPAYNIVQKRKKLYASVPR